MRHFIIVLVVCIASPMSWAGSKGHRGSESSSQSGARPVAHVVELDSQELEGITNQQQALSAFQDWLKQRFPDPKKKILVKFGASWCGPCRTLAPQVEKFAADRSGDYAVISVDLDKYRTLAEALQYGGTVPSLFELTKGAETNLSDNKEKVGPIKGIPAIPNYLKTR